MRPNGYREIFTADPQRCETQCPCYVDAKSKRWSMPIVDVAADSAVSGTKFRQRFAGIELQ